MPFIILIVLIVAAVFWWVKSQQAMSPNEKLYLRRRGYEVGDDEAQGPPVPRDTRLFSLIEALEDLTPYSRQRAAEEISQMCETGQKDQRFFAPLITALDDSNAAVRGAVALALASLGDLRAIEPLTRRMETDESVHVRASARRAIEKLKGETVKG